MPPLRSSACTSAAVVAPENEHVGGGVFLLDGRAQQFDCAVEITGAQLLVADEQVYERGRSKREALL